MASKAGTVLKIIAAWALLPAGLAALGYYVIGPKLGAKDGDSPKEAPPASSSEGEASSEEDAPKTYAEPKIEVSVRKGAKISARDISRPRRRKKPTTPKPEPSAPEVSTPTIDPPKTQPETIPVDGGNGAGTGAGSPL